MTDTKKRSTPARSTGGGSGALSAEERAALKDLVKERKAEATRGKGAKARADGERALLDAIAEMPPADRAMAERIHEIVTATAPQLAPRTWYGMPAYARDGKVVCFFQSAAKFKARYATLGFDQAATLDDGTMWPTSFALKELTAADETRIAELVRKATA